MVKILKYLESLKRKLKSGADAIGIVVPTPKDYGIIWKNLTLIISDF